MVGSITVNASAPIDASSYSLDYILYDSTANLIYVSDSSLGLVYSSSQSLGVSIGRVGKSLIMYEMFYNSDLGCWASALFSSRTENTTFRDTVGGSSSKSHISFGRFAGHAFYTNGDWGTQFLMKEPQYSNFQCSHTVIPSLDGIQLPGGNIQDIINESLNSTTETTTTANSLQNGLAQDYTSYQNGDISSQGLQVSIDNTVENLNNLNNTNTNTLADLVAIQNGLTYAQTVQDKVIADEIIDTQKVSSSVSQNISGYITQANNGFSEYSSGTKTQSETITLLQQQIINLNNMITNGQAVSSADISAVNSAVNTVNGIINNVGSYSDMDKSVSESVQQSDQEDIDYLNQLVGETTSQIQDMSAEQQFQTQQKTESQNVLLSIWDLEILKRLVPICSVFMVICVALGIKYRL